MNLSHEPGRGRPPREVSSATVSRVLNNASVVKTSTRARVMKAIRDLKYHPNLHARSLAGGKSRTLGVIVSNLENPFFFDIYVPSRRKHIAAVTTWSWPTPTTGRNNWWPVSG